MASLTHYEALNVPPTATALDIKRAYHELLLRYHPDKVAADAANIKPSDLHGARSSDTVPSVEFHAIQVAWDVLKSEETRSLYDRTRTGLAAKEKVAVSAEVDLDEMECSLAAGQYCYTHACRCSGLFQLSEQDLINNAATSSSILVPCSQCSLHVRVSYSEAADEPTDE